MPVLWNPDTCDCAILQDNKTGEQISDPKYNHLVKKCKLHKNVATKDLKKAITQHRINNKLINLVQDQDDTKKKILMHNKRKAEKKRISNL